ncbi:MAG TPA: PKD domain-containing protein [Planctomycetota bacterium]|nr:PKD domain-containing protein [Planctomycetota bacterium]
MRQLSVAASRRATLPVAILAVLSFGFLASAASYIKTTLRELTHTAVAVAEVEVTGKQYPELEAGQTFPRTHIEAKVVRSLKGELSESIVIDTPGGIHNGIASYVPDGPDFKTGERAMVFLKKPADANGRYMVQDLGLGKFNIVERDGKRFVESPLCPRAMETKTGNLGDLEAELITRSIPYDTFCKLVATYADGKVPDTDVVALASGLPIATAHNHTATPAVMTDLVEQKKAASERKGMWLLAGSVFLAALLAFVWVRHRRKSAARSLSTQSIVVLMSAALLGGSGFGAACHAFVQFDQKTIWNLDTPRTGKVASNRIIWRQSTSVAKDNPNSFSGVQNAFDQWEGVDASRLAFTAGGSTSTAVNNSGDTENVVAWTTSPSNDFSSNTLAICFSSFTVGTTSNFVDGDIIFNDRDFNWGPGGQGNVISVSLHEIGHFIGLNHTTDQKAVMFPFDKGFTTLQPDEVLAAQTLYPGAAGAPGAGGVAPPPAPGGPVVTASGSPTTGLPPLNVSFTGAATPGSSGNAITNLSWSFGDGNSASGANVSNTYTSSGSFTATLTATDAGGLTGKATVKVDVGELANTAKAQFKLNFASIGKDAFSATLSSGELIGFKDPRGTGSNEKGYLNIGDQSWQFDYDTEKGKSTNKFGPKVSVNDKNGTVTMMIRNADLRDVLGGHGAIDDDVFGETVGVPVVIWFGEKKKTFIFAEIQFTYFAKATKSGTGKF